MMLYKILLGYIFGLMEAHRGSAIAAGFGDGIDLIGGELLSFTFPVIVYILSPAGRAMEALGGTVTIALSAFALIVLMIQVIQNLFIGLFAPDDFSLGFLLGDLVVIIFAIVVLWPVMPNAVIGMALAFVMVFVGIIVKSTGIVGGGIVESKKAKEQPDDAISYSESI